MILENLSPHLIVGLEGPELTDNERTFLRETPPAGIILFERNVSGYNELRALVSEAAGIIEDASGSPPLIAADHEGGRISVLHRALGVPPTQMAIGKTKDPELCMEVFKETALLMKSCGVNWYLGPVADINSEYLNPVIGTRSFGEDEELVTTLVLKALEALAGAGILSCLKHFPGHGATASDSHLTLPALSLTVDQLRLKDIKPFARGIEAAADSVMTGHIAPRDRMLPASLDRELVQGILREELSFVGVIVTDALEMAGVTGAYDIGALGQDEGSRDAASHRGICDVARMALEAGNDLLLYSRPAGEVYSRLREQLDSIPMDDDFWNEGITARLEDSIARIETIRKRAEEYAAGSPAGKPAGTPTVYLQAAGRSVRRLHDRSMPLPIEPGRPMRLVFCGEERDFESSIVARFAEVVVGKLMGGAEIEALSGGIQPETLRKGISCRLPGLDYIVELRELELGESGPGSVNILVLLNRRPLWQEALKLLCADFDVVVIAGWPYAAGFILYDHTAVVTYGVYEEAAEAACDAILGGG
jgi:beta-glucosidase-like glycosyl hydrolase